MVMVMKNNKFIILIAFLMISGTALSENNIDHLKANNPVTNQEHKKNIKSKDIKPLSCKSGYETCRIGSQVFCCKPSADCDTDSVDCYFDH